MSQAEDLLNSLTATDHIVIGSDRRITVPAALKRIAVQYDHNMETVTFDCPRYWDGIDMSKMDIYVNYKRADGYLASYRVDTRHIDDTEIRFDWIISRNVTAVKGNLSFSICIKEIDEVGNELNHWNSEINNEMTVSEGLEVHGHIAEEYPDIITSLVRSTDELNEKIESMDNGITLTDVATNDKYIIYVSNGQLTMKSESEVE